MATSSSFGTKVGRGLGVVGALAIEGCVRGAYGLGQFGADVIDGAEQGYAEKSAALLITREQKRALAAAKREAAVQQHKLALAAATVSDVAQAAVVEATAPLTTKRVRAKA